MAVDYLARGMAANALSSAESTSAIGKYLSTWSCITGLPETNPQTTPYAYTTGDYFIVTAVNASSTTHSLSVSGTDNGGQEFSTTFSFSNNVSTAYTTVADLSAALYAAGHNQHSGTCQATGTCGTYTLGYVASDDGEDLLLQTSTTEAIGYVLNASTGITLTDSISTNNNYKPSGSSYEGPQHRSTTVDTSTIAIGDMYRYDGTTWELLKFSATYKWEAINGKPFTSVDSTTMEVVNNVLKAKVGEAPSDSKVYGRKNGEWTEESVSDVQIGGVSILSSGVADIPKASSQVYGVVRPNPTYGTSVTDGYLGIAVANEQALIAKNRSAQAIAPTMLDIAMREGLGNNSLTWTDAYKQSARNTIGAAGADEIVSDVQVNGTSVVSAGIANIPRANASVDGVVKINSNYGMNMSGGCIYPIGAAEAKITARASDSNGSIMPSNFDFAVKAALTDGVGTAYTDAEKTAARTRIGASKALPTIVNDRYLHTTSTGDLEWSEVTGCSDAALESAKSTNGIGYKTSTYTFSYSWDGTTTGRDHITEDGYDFYKVSDSIPDLTKVDGSIYLDYEVSTETDTQYVVDATSITDCADVPNGKNIDNYIIVVTSGSQLGTYASYYEEDGEVWYTRSWNVDVVASHNIDMNYVPELASASKTNGIGYVIDGGQILTWDGSTEGRETIGGYYKISSTVPSNVDDIIGTTFTASNGDKCTVSNKEISGAVSGYLFGDSEAESTELQQAILVITSGGNKGIYFLYYDSATPYVTSWDFTTHTISSNYVDGMTNLALSESSKGLGYAKTDSFDLTWDGDTTGKSVILTYYYKVASNQTVPDVTKFVGGTVRMNQTVAYSGYITITSVTQDSSNRYALYNSDGGITLGYLVPTGTANKYDVYLLRYVESSTTCYVSRLSYGKQFIRNDFLNLTSQYATSNIVEDGEQDIATVLFVEGELSSKLAAKVSYTDKLSQITGSMTDAEKATLWGRQAIIKTTMDSVAVAGAKYFLGEQTAVSFSLPSTASTGQEISVVFYTRSSATRLSISGNTIGTIPTPAAGQRIELNMQWDGEYWAVVSNVLLEGAT